MITRPKELRKYLGISEATYYRLKRAGEFPSPVMLSTRIYGFRSEDIEKWIAERQSPITKKSSE